MIVHLPKHYKLYTRKCSFRFMKINHDIQAKRHTAAVTASWDAAAEDSFEIRNSNPSLGNMVRTCLREETSGEYNGFQTMTNEPNYLNYVTRPY